MTGAQWEMLSGGAGRAEAEEGWQLMIEQDPFHELEEWEALLSMLRLLASLVMLGRQCFACPRRPFLSCLGWWEAWATYELLTVVAHHAALFVSFVKISAVEVYNGSEEGAGLGTVRLPMRARQPHDEG